MWIKLFVVMISKFNDIAKKVKSYNTISFKATFIAIALLFLFLSSSYAGSVSKGLKLIYRGEFEKAEALLLKDFDSLNCPANFALAKLYFDKRNPKFNYYEAYKYVELSIHYKDNNSKLKEYDINIDTIERLQNNIDNFAYQDALKQNSIEVYLKYTRQFKDNENLTECLNNLNDLAYKQAIQKNTIKDYNYFLTNFLDANQGLVNDVLDRIARLEMLDCVEKKSIYCLKTFRKAHKANWCFFEATNAIDRIQLDSCYQNKDLRSLEWFLKNSPESKFIDEATNKYEGMFYTSIITKNNMDSFEMFLDKFPFSSRFKEIEDTIYNKYTNYGQDSIKLKEFFDFYPSNVNIPMAQKKYYSIFTNNGKDTLKISQYLSKNPTIFFKDDVELDYYLASTLNEQSLLDLSKYIKSHPNTTYTGRAINKHFYLFSNKYIKTDSLTYYSINYPFITNVLSLYKIIKNKIIDDCYPNLATTF